MSELESRAAEAGAFGEVFVAFPDDPQHGPRLRIVSAARRVLISVPLLALVEAGDSPWAELEVTGQPGDGDPYGYSGAQLCIKADEGTVTYRIGGYLPAQRSYTADRAGVAAEPDGDAVRRLTLYGSCEDCGTPRDVRTTAEADGSLLVEMFCPGCASRLVRSRPRSKRPVRVVPCRRRSSPTAVRS